MCKTVFWRSKHFKKLFTKKIQKFSSAFVLILYSMDFSKPREINPEKTSKNKYIVHYFVFGWDVRKNKINGLVKLKKKHEVIET